MADGKKFFFDLKNQNLQFNVTKSTLICKDKNSEKSIWIKRLNKVSIVSDIIEDASKYYLITESNDVFGQYIVLSKETGTTLWFIPGKAFFHILFQDDLYIIFADEKEKFFLIKVDRSNGNKLWHHKINSDLLEYRFTKTGIHLTYKSGTEETISPVNGLKIY